MDHRKIAVRMPVMKEVQFSFPPEPCRPLKSVVLLIEEDVCVERRRACDYPSGLEARHHRLDLGYTRNLFNAFKIPHMDHCVRDARSLWGTLTSNGG
jgi:hypothetical protein